MGNEVDFEDVNKFCESLFKKLSAITLEETKKPGVSDDVILAGILSVCVQYVTSCICSLRFDEEKLDIPEQRRLAVDFFAKSLRQHIDMINQEEHPSD